MEVKDLNNKIIQSLKKKLEKVIRKLKATHVFGLGGNNILEIISLRKSIYRFNEIPIKTALIFLTVIKIQHCKFFIENCKTQDSQKSLSKNTNTEVCYSTLQDIL